MEIKNLVDNSEIIFLSHGGLLTQNLIVGMTEALEGEVEFNNLSMGISSNIYTIFIELSQNILNYSKKHNDVKADDLIVAGRDSSENYYTFSQNIITTEDKEKIEPKLLEIIDLNKDEIKKRYKELRRSGKNKHKKGGGIGFYEIAKRCDKIKYQFVKTKGNMYYFYFIALIDVNSSKNKKD